MPDPKTALDIMCERDAIKLYITAEDRGGTPRFTEIKSRDELVAHLVKYEPGADTNVTLEWKYSGGADAMLLEFKHRRLEQRPSGFFIRKGVAQFTYRHAPYSRVSMTNIMIRGHRLRTPDDVVQKYQLLPLTPALRAS